MRLPENCTWNLQSSHTDRGLPALLNSGARAEKSSESALGGGVESNNMARGKERMDSWLWKYDLSGVPKGRRGVHGYGSQSDLRLKLGDAQQGPGAARGDRELLGGLSLRGVGGGFGGRGRRYDVGHVG